MRTSPAPMNSDARHLVPALTRSSLREIVGWVEQAVGEYETAFRWYEPSVSCLALAYRGSRGSMKPFSCDAAGGSRFDNTAITYPDFG